MHYEASNTDFASAESAHRYGFAAALHPDRSGMTWDQTRESLRATLGREADADAFRRGYERSQARARRRAGSAKRSPTAR